jgi:phage terminase small subunit
MSQQKQDTADKLTPKQELFVREFLVDLNATKAAIRAGYSEKTAAAIGWENLRKPEIQKALAGLIQPKMRKLDITTEYILGTIQETIERCKQEIEVLDREGKPTGEYRFDPNAVLKGCELLGKYRKLWTEKHELFLPRPSEMTQEQLDAVAKAWGVK